MSKVIDLFKSSWQSFRSSVRGFDTHRQLALGCAFGMMIGLIPKDSLFVYAIAFIAVLSSANLLCVAVAGCVFHWISGPLDPFWDNIGATVLTHASLASTWAMVNEWPMVAWTRFSNTVVAGTLTAGLILFLPFYFICSAFFVRFGKQIHTRFSGSSLARWIMGTSPQSLQET